MPKLTINTGTALGPLSVEVLTNRGMPFGRPMNMSSLRQTVEIEEIPVGEYTVVATRPSGEQLIANAKVGTLGGFAKIAPIGASPREYLSEASRLGLIYTRDESKSEEGDLRQRAIQTIGMEGAVARVIGTLLRNQSLPSADELPSLAQRFRDLNRSSLTEDNSTSVRRSTDYKLAKWRFEKSQWHSVAISRENLSSDYLEEPSDYLRVKVEQETSPVALALLNNEGFGPIVIVPQFLEGIDVTFLSAGVAMEAHASRTGNPSSVRVPVAIAVPRQVSLADLLVGINAPLFPGANELFNEARFDVTERAVNFIEGKYGDPAAAVLGAIFLARFAPDQLSLEWLQNLKGILPDVADSWVLLAIAALNQRGIKTDETVITEYLRKATTCRCTLFSRTRLSLNKMSFRYGPFPRSRQDEVKSPRRPRTGDFLDFAAEAGGLESFWGYSPNRPGYDGIRVPQFGFGIRMQVGKFVG